MSGSFENIHRTTPWSLQSRTKSRNGDLPEFMFFKEHLIAASPEAQEKANVWRRYPRVGYAAWPTWSAPTSKSFGFAHNYSDAHAN